MAMSADERKRALGFGAGAEIARRTGRKAGHISQVLSGTRRDRKVEVAAARMLRKAVDEVFPPAESQVPAGV